MARQGSSLAETALLRALYERLPIVLCINATVGLGTVLVFGSLGSRRAALLWGCGLLLALLLRCADWLWFRHLDGAGSFDRWRWRYTLGAGITGLAWGAAGMVFHRVGGIEAQVFLPFVLAGMVGGSLTVLTGCMSAYIAFLFCTLTPYTLALAWSGGLTASVMVALLVFYMISLTLLARQLNRTLQASVTLAAENETLIGALQAKQDQLEATFEHINQGVAVFDAHACLVAWNPRHAALHGYPGRLYHEGVHLRQFLDYDLCRTDQHNRELVPQAIVEPLAPARFEQHGAADLILSVERSPMPDGGFVTTSTDITEHKQAEARMRHLAQHDVLTDLPNRLLFQDRLDQAIARARRGGDLLGVMLIDLDKFKAINDEFGHGIGDQVLRVAGTRLIQTLRATDTVARIGGDEFALILPDLSSAGAALAIAHKTLRQLSAPLTIDGRQLPLQGSLGIALFPTDGQSIAQLMQCADIAMYRAKRAGGGAKLHRHLQGYPGPEDEARAS